MRKAKISDAKLVWELSNDPLVRRVSFNPESIPWESHIEWFSKMIQDQGCLYFLFFESNRDSHFLGQVRMHEIVRHSYEISISISASCRGKGYGKSLILMALTELLSCDAEGVVHAWTKPDNYSSIRLFRSCGFVEMGTEKESTGIRFHFIYRPENAKGNAQHG